MPLGARFEAEAKRIAQLLHDEAGQTLACVHFALDDLAPALPPHARRRLDEVRQRLTEAEDQLRRLAHELHPAVIDHLGILPALRFLAEGVSQRTKLHVAVEGSIGRRLPQAVQIALYRIVQEALANVTRHAGARQASVTIRRKPEVVWCSIQDDGRGFDVRAALGGPNGLGLMGIRERVASLQGTLDIASAPGRGTRLFVSIPLDSKY